MYIYRQVVFTIYRQIYKQNIDKSFVDI